jgi:hypothetical protein
LPRFDPTSQEILRQLAKIQTSQDSLLHLVRCVTTSQPQHAASVVSQSSNTQLHHDSHVHDSLSWDDSGHGNGSVQHQDTRLTFDWFGEQPDSEASPAASTGVAAVQWFGLLAKDASREAHQETDVPAGSEVNLLDPFNAQYEGETTPLQRATRIIDGQPVGKDSVPGGGREQDFWQSSESITLLEREQILFENFLHRICSWVGFPSSPYTRITEFAN